MKYLLLTFGCQMNKSDSERIRSILDGAGLEETESEADMDFVLMNTCSVRQKAENRIYSLVKKYHTLRKKDRPNLIIGVTGCMPGRDHDHAMKKKLPHVDLWFDIQRIPELPAMLSEFHYEIPHTNPLDEHYLSIKPKYKNAFQAFVPIQTGCNKFCTYCVVPFSRGLEVNRPVKTILEEIREFADQGGLEVTLLGQTVNSFKAVDESYFSTQNPYHDHFAKLLWEINHIEGIERIHFTAPHPRDMSDEVIDALTLPKHLKFLHLPVQSGSDSILKKMNRQYTGHMYKDLIDKIRAKNPDIALGTDIIVGFCGETEADFLETVELFKYCQFDISYTAQYSPRTGTLAYKGMPDDVSYEEKKRRWHIMQDLMEEITYKKNLLFQNQTVSVLFDEFEGGYALGWTEHLKKVRVKSPLSLSGLLLKVNIIEAKTWILEGNLITKPPIQKLKITKPIRGLPML